MLAVVGILREEVPDDGEVAEGAGPFHAPNHAGAAGVRLVVLAEGVRVPKPHVVVIGDDDRADALVFGRCHEPFEARLGKASEQELVACRIVLEHLEATVEPVDPVCVHRSSDVRLDVGNRMGVADDADPTVLPGRGIGVVRLCQSYRRRLHATRSPLGCNESEKDVGCGLGHGRGSTSLHRIDGSHHGHIGASAFGGDLGKHLGARGAVLPGELDLVSILSCAQIDLGELEGRSRNVVAHACICGRNAARPGERAAPGSAAEVASIASAPAVATSNTTPARTAGHRYRDRAPIPRCSKIDISPRLVTTTSHTTTVGLRRPRNAVSCALLR